MIKPKIYINMCNPDTNFLFGLDFNRGTAEDMNTNETSEVCVFSIGFLIFEINIVW